MLYLCEFEIIEKQGMYEAYPIGLEGATCGNSLTDVAEMAADWLKGDADLRLMLGQEIPELPLGNTPSHDQGRILLVAVEANVDTIDAVSATEAAEMLGVTRGRVSQMLKAGQLLGFTRGRNTYVSRDSLEARLAEAPKAGRPKKLATA